MAGIKPLQIDAHAEKDLASDFSRLRQHSIDLLQQLTGSSWTDYNLHDPGVTILELLCFALTDLSYRTGFPLTEILGLRQGKHREWENAFFPAKRILTTSPITINDIRKVILDEVEEISNIWIGPVVSDYSSDSVKGLYNIYAQVEEEITDTLLQDAAAREKLKEKIKKVYVSRRNICEDCVREIMLMEPVPVKIVAEVEMNERFLPEEVLADIYSRLDAYFNTPVRIRSEQELLQQGLSVEEIYTGPLLKKGFIRDDELNAPASYIDPVELIDIITRVEGVLLVRKLLVTADSPPAGKTPLSPEVYHFVLDKRPEGSHIKLYKNRYEIPIRQSVLQDQLTAFRQKKKRQQRIAAPATALEQTTMQGDPPGSSPIYLSAAEIEKYYSIQDHFPLIYGIGAEGLPRTDKSRRAKARQLKGYLLLFEQIMGNYLSQLAHVHDFFSIRLDVEDPRSYYAQPLYTIPGVADLLKAFTESGGYKADEDNSGTGDSADWKAFKNDPENKYARLLRAVIEPEDTWQKRKNAVYDHLLARHNEGLDEYPVTLYDHLYGEARDDQKVDTVLKWKSELLRNMTELSHDRARAFDYTLTSGSTGTVVGLEKRMLLLLHIPPREKRALTDVFQQKNVSLRESGAAAATEDSGDAAERQDAQSPPLILENQSISLFRYGINPSNYKISPSVYDKNKMQVLYKEPEALEWRVIAGGQDQASATKMIGTLTDTLKQISLKSEGFHLVEHVLLRPTLTGKSFGFGLYRREKDRVARHRTWETFEGRENTIREILEAGGAGQGGGSQEGNVPGRDGKETIDNGKRIDARLAALCQYEQDPKKVRQTIGLYRPGGQQFFPRFDMYTRRWGHSILREDFFNFRITVVLPGWPARFQSKNFKLFTEELFRRHGPAHLHMHFLWLGISEMQKFEKIYFEWRDLFYSREGKLDSCEETEKLIDLIHPLSFRVV